MARYVAFLRGINLGGRRITNEALRSHFEALGCEEVATFRASGNVIFSEDGRPAELASQLEEGLAEELGYEVPVFLCSEKELSAIAGDDDLLAIEGRELYWLPSGGMSDSELDLKALAALLGPITIRTKGTIDQIATKHFA
jgi:uncharacterized protein (DUF1697 family)